MKNKKIIFSALGVFLAIFAMVFSDIVYQKQIGSESGAFKVPAYSGKPYVEINGNQPGFSKKDMTAEVFETYSDLDSLGRCGTAFANVCKEVMPSEERGEIGMIKPSGWHTVKYPDVIEDLYLYNICKEHCMFILHLA